MYNNLKNKYNDINYLFKKILNIYIYIYVTVDIFNSINLFKINYITIINK